MNINLPTATVYLVDDDAAVRDALELLLQAHGHQVRAFESGEDFLAAVDADSVGCAILDVRMDGLSGLDVFDQLLARGSGLIVLFLSGHGDIPMAVQAVKQGAFDFLEKPCCEDALLRKIAEALAMTAGRQRLRQEQQVVQARLARLSPRERDVMRQILSGKLNKQIADELNITVRTVEVHRANVFNKMEVRSAVDLAQLLAVRD